MGALTKSFLVDFETNLRSIVESAYTAFSQNLWWDRFMLSRATASRKEIVAWLLSTAQIQSINKFGGEMPFADLLQTSASFEVGAAAAGLRLRRFQLEDLDGNGVDLAAKWANDIGQYMAYWPQKQLVSLITNGETGTTYDGQAFFSASHPYNPENTGSGTFQNLFTGAESGAYPGACPIDDSVSIDTALTNLSKVIAYVKTIKMPNGADPRFLRPRAILAPPRMQQRVTQMLNARFIAQVASSGAGSADVEALIKSFGVSDPVIADELAGNDTTWYLACEETIGTQIGAFLYLDREPFKITYYTGQGGGNGVDAVLDRADELEWHCKGRNVAAYGHPYLFFKVKAT